MTRKQLIALGLMVVLIFSLAACSSPDPAPDPEDEEDEVEETVEWPTGNIEWIVHASAGGGSDIAARTVGRLMQEHGIVDANIAVSNHTGGDGAVQMDYVQGQEADGHTWALMTGAQFGTMIRGLADYDMDDWIPVANMQVDPRWLAKRADDDRWEDVQAVIDHARENPGEVSIAGMGFGTDYMVINLFMEQEDIEVEYVPHDSTGDAVVALLGEHTDLLMGSIVSFIDYVTDGQIDPLFIFWEEASGQFPDVPSGAELGHDTAYLATIRGLYVKAGTPQEIVDMIEAAVFETMATDDYLSYEEESLLDIVEGRKDQDEYLELSLQYWDMFEHLIERLEE